MTHNFRTASHITHDHKKSLQQNTPESSFGENGKIARLREGDGEQWGWWEKEREEEKEGVM